MAPFTSFSNFRGRHKNTLNESVNCELWVARRSLRSAAMLRFPLRRLGRLRPSQNGAYERSRPRNPDEDKVRTAKPTDHLPCRMPALTEQGTYRTIYQS